MSLVIFYPCQQAYTPYSYICGGPCYLFESAPCLIDWSINVVVPLSVTSVANMILISLNIKQKHRMKRSIITARNSQQWRRTIKLSAQLFSISTFCIIGWIPYGVVSTMQIFANTDFLTYLLSTYFIYFPYFQTLFLPYACLMFMPEIKQKFFDIVTKCRLCQMIYRNNRVHIDEQTHTLTRVPAYIYHRTIPRVIQ